MTTKHALALLAAGSTALAACLAEPEHLDDKTTHASSIISPDPGEALPSEPVEPVEPVEPAPDVRHEPIGNAVITKSDGVLEATNMRSLSDGVRSIPAEPSVGWLLEPAWDPMVSAIDLRAINGRLPGSGLEGNMRVERVSANEWLVDVSFPEQSDDTGTSAPAPGPDLPYFVNVYHSGELVGSAYIIPGQTDIRILHDDTDTCPLCEWLARRNSDGLQRYSWKLHSKGGLLTVIVDGETFAGNMIEFIEVEPHEFRGGLDKVELRGNANVVYKSETFRTDSRLEPSPNPSPVEPVPSNPVEPAPGSPAKY